MPVYLCSFDVDKLFIDGTCTLSVMAILDKNFGVDDVLPTDWKVSPFKGILNGDWDDEDIQAYGCLRDSCQAQDQDQLIEKINSFEICCTGFRIFSNAAQVIDLLQKF